MTDVVATNQTIIVVGGGISGMTTALEAAEAGKQVILLEKRPYLAGRVSQLYKYFPKICHPTCGQEINQRRIKMNKNLTVITKRKCPTSADRKFDYTVSVTITPRYVAAIAPPAATAPRSQRLNLTTNSTTTSASARAFTCPTHWHSRSNT